MLSLFEMLYSVFSNPLGRFLLLCVLAVAAGIYVAKWTLA